MVVVLLLAVIWAAVLVPPAVVAHRERQEAFLLSIGQVPSPDERGPRRHSLCVQRRRRIAGGLLVAMAATLLVGLLPTFRVLLVVHLFLLDSFLGYVAVLAHQANRSARAARARIDASADVIEEEGDALQEAPVRRVRVGRMPRPAILPDLGTIAAAR